MKIFEINFDYINFLQKFDSRVSDPKINEFSGRKYVGPLIEYEGLYYFAPLSSQVYFTKKDENGLKNYVLDDDGNKKIKNRIGDLYLNDSHRKPLALVRLNFMIPIPELSNKYIQEVDWKELLKSEHLQDKNYGWIIREEEKALNTKFIQNLLHNKINLFLEKYSYDHKLRNSCCNFKLLESKSKEYQLNLLKKQTILKQRMDYVQYRKELLGSLSYEENHIKKSGIEIEKINDGLRYIQDSTILDVVFSPRVKEEESCKLKKIEENHYVLPVIARDVKCYNLIGEQIWSCLDDSKCNELEEDMERTR